MKNKPKVILMNLDGVVTDTQKIKTQVSVDLLYHRYGVDITPEEFEEKYSGLKTRYVFKNIFDEYEINDDLDDFLDDRVAEMEGYIEKDVPMINGSLEFLDSVKELGFKVVLASSASRGWVDKITKKLDIRTRFDAINYSDEVESNRPSPEIYFLSIDRLKVLPEDCILIENAKDSVSSEKRDNIKSVAVVENLYDSCDCDLSVMDLTDPKLIEYVKDFKIA